MVEMSHTNEDIFEDKTEIRAEGALDAGSEATRCCCHLNGHTHMYGFIDVWEIFYICSSPFQIETKDTLNLYNVCNHFFAITIHEPYGHIYIYTYLNIPAGRLLRHF